MQPTKYDVQVASTPTDPRDRTSYFSSGISPFVKWPGGKTSELSKISLAMPSKSINRYIEPFVGGGSVLLALRPEIQAHANDICPELIHLYIDPCCNSPKVETELRRLAALWDFISDSAEVWEQISTSLKSSTTTPQLAAMQVNEHLASELSHFGKACSSEFSRRLSKDLPTKLKRIEKLQIDKGRTLPIDEFIRNIEGSIRAAFYMAIRKRYNQLRSAGILDPTRVADFFFIREYCYASMFRFNGRGEFNVPYGGISYNRKRFFEKVERLYSDPLKRRLSNTTFYNLDFEEFLQEVKPNENDFLFIDPPYDSDFTDYDDKEFREHDQRRLAKTLDASPAMVMIVIGDTELVRELYPAPRWHIQEDKKTYKWTIKDRNDRSKTHLTITNYK